MKKIHWDGFREAKKIVKIFKMPGKKIVNSWILASYRNEEKRENIRILKFWHMLVNIFLGWQIL